MVQRLNKENKIICSQNQILTTEVFLYQIHECVLIRANSTHIYIQAGVNYRLENEDSSDDAFWRYYYYHYCFYLVLRVGMEEICSRCWICMY